MSPSSPLLLKFKLLSWTNRPTVVGMKPVREFPDISIVVRRVSKPMDVGIDPISDGMVVDGLRSRRTCKFVNNPISGGIVPFKLLFSISSEMSKPDGSQGNNIDEENQVHSSSALSQFD